MEGASPPDSQLGRHYIAEPLSNLNNYHLPLSPQYPPPWQLPTANGSSSWDQAPQDSTLVGPDPGQPWIQPNRPPVSIGNIGKRKRGTLSGGASSVGGFGPLPSGDTTTEASFTSEPLPQPTRSSRRNAASNVWAFAQPLNSFEPLLEDQQLTSLEPINTSKPNTPWFGCKLCPDLGCVASC
jgi:hypothetical protein